jgi:type II secretory pathway component PulM
MIMEPDSRDSRLADACRTLIATLQGLTPREREILLADPGTRGQLVRLLKLLSEVEKEF